jgi:hypothetical protein
MDLIDFANQMGDDIKRKREAEKAMQAKVEQAEKERLQKEKDHKENKKRGMI